MDKVTSLNLTFVGLLRIKDNSTIAKCFNIDCLFVEKFLDNTTSGIVELFWVGENPFFLTGDSLEELPLFPLDLLLVRELMVIILFFLN